MGDLEDIIRRIVREEIRAAFAEQRSPVLPESASPRESAWLTVGAVAERAACHEVTVRRALETGELRGRQRAAGTRWSVRACCVDSWLEGGFCDGHASEKLLGPREAAVWLQVDVGTLANWRTQGKGPAFVKLGRSVRYRLDDLGAWIGADVGRS